MCNSAATSLGAGLRPPLPRTPSRWMPGSRRARHGRLVPADVAGTGGPILLANHWRGAAPRLARFAYRRCRAGRAAVGRLNRRTQFSTMVNNQPRNDSSLGVIFEFLDRTSRPAPKLLASDRLHRHLASLACAEIPGSAGSTTPRTGTRNPNPDRRAGAKAGSDAVVCESDMGRIHIRGITANDQSNAKSLWNLQNEKKPASHAQDPCWIGWPACRKVVKSANNRDRSESDRYSRLRSGSGSSAEASDLPGVRQIQDVRASLPLASLSSVTSK